MQHHWQTQRRRRAHWMWPVIFMFIWVQGAASAESFDPIREHPAAGLQYVAGITWRQSWDAAQVLDSTGSLYERQMGQGTLVLSFELRRQRGLGASISAPISQGHNRVIKDGEPQALTQRHITGPLSLGLAWPWGQGGRRFELRTTANVPFGDSSAPTTFGVALTGTLTSDPVVLSGAVRQAVPAGDWSLGGGVTLVLSDTMAFTQTVDWQLGSAPTLQHAIEVAYSPGDVVVWRAGVEMRHEYGRTLPGVMLGLTRRFP